MGEEGVVGKQSCASWKLEIAMSLFYVVMPIVSYDFQCYNTIVSFDPHL